MLRDSTDVEGRTLPHDLEAERCLLGACLVNREAYPGVVGMSGDSNSLFYRHAHNLIFQEMGAIYQAGDPIDSVGVFSRVKSRGLVDEVGGFAYLAQLTDGMPASANYRAWAKIVLEKRDLRRTISNATQVLSAAYNHDPDATARAVAHLQTSAVSALDVDHTPIHSLPVFLAKNMETPQVPPLVDRLIPGVGVTMIHGQPRDRKTLAVLDACVALATGSKAFNLLNTTPTPTDVWYISDEDPEQEVFDRLVKILAGRGLDITNPPAHLHLSIQEGVNLDEPFWQDYVIRQTKALGIKLVVIDPVRAHTACADAGPKEFKPFGDFLRRFNRETGVAILLIHHDTKPANDGRPDSRRRAQRASGGGIFSAAQTPISTERLSETHTLMAVDSCKFGADPSPLELAFDWSDGLRITGRFTEGQQVESVSLDALILDYVASNPGVKSGDIPAAINRRRPDVLAALDRLEAGRKVRHSVNGRAKHWQVAS